MEGVQQQNRVVAREFPSVLGGDFLDQGFEGVGQTMVYGGERPVFGDRPMGFRYTRCSQVIYFASNGF